MVESQMPDTTAVAMQKAIIARLRGSVDVTLICPAADIFDRSTRPERSICIVLGEDQIVRESITYEDDQVRLYSTLHLWHKSQDFTTIKTLGDLIRIAMRPRFVVPGIYVAFQSFDNARYMRDPDGEFVHGVVQFGALITEPVT
jgi:hypothetical protein